MTDLVEACARALFHFDTGWRGIPAAQEDALWEQEGPMYLARARAVIPVVLNSLREPTPGFLTVCREHGIGRRHWHELAAAFVKSLNQEV